MSDDLRRSTLGEAREGDRCSPALIVAAACSEERDGDRGDGGLGRAASCVLMEILRGRAAIGDPGPEGGLEVGRVFRSGGMMLLRRHVCRRQEVSARKGYRPYCWGYRVVV